MTVIILSIICTICFYCGSIRGYSSAKTNEATIISPRMNFSNKLEFTMVIRVARNLFSLENIYSDKLLGSLTAAEV